MRACSGLLICCLLLRSQTPSGSSESPREFVQAFYNWYVPKALAEKAGPAWQLALKQKSSVFSPELARALNEDSAAQARVTDDIVGLDFDPFLSSQDPCKQYQAGEAVRKGSNYVVDVYAVCSGRKRPKADVAAELTRNDGRWLFVNFHYDRERRLAGYAETASRQPE